MPVLRRFLFAAVETADFPVIIIDCSGRIISVNAAAAGQTNISLKEYAHRYFWEVFYDGRILDNEGGFLSPLVETMATGKEFTNRYDVAGTVRHATKSGRFVTTLVTYNHDGSIGMVWGLYFPTHLIQSLYIEKMPAVRSIIEIIGSRDRYTRGHMGRVTVYALTLGHRLSLAPADMSRLFLAAMIHDVGKLFVPEHILKKPAELTNEEMAAMRLHPEHAVGMLTSFSMPKDIIAIVRHHHERFDGTGYPGGLKGQASPFLSRVLAVADAFEAMTADRVYRPAFTITAALDELAKNAGSQFDPLVVQAMLDFADSTGIAGCKDYVSCLDQAPCPQCP
jgi:HD-GYP domain-containing protein (c-di-GMP phosphodiesterase class II)